MSSAQLGQRPSSGSINAYRRMFDRELVAVVKETSGNFEKFLVRLPNVPATKHYSR